MSGFHRRQILRAGVTALADFVFGRPLTPPALAETRRGIFDAHLHIPSDNGENFQWSLVTRNMQEFVAYLDKCGVKRGVISSSWSNKAQTPEDYQQGNREVAKYVDRYKGRFRGSCVITPFRIDEALREIEHCHQEYGFVWLGEFCNYMTGYRYDTPEWAEVMTLAARLNLVIQIHTNVREMEHLAERFPEATIVFPHLGGNRDDIFKRIDIVARHKNTHIELSGSGIERVGILEKAVKEIGADRVLYGSDFTINEPSAVIARVKNAFLTAEDREKILFRNVERLLARAGAGPRP
ncbi:MAG: amidohydrolase family protein [Candidatus Solibacter usitatus]|nr:amidohydrolase family protein [Candidatus Solibacter usitatus]